MQMRLSPHFLKPEDMTTKRCSKIQCGHIENMVPSPLKAKIIGVHLKSYLAPDIAHVRNLMLLSKSKQSMCLDPVIYVSLQESPI